jgi:MFS superfamily sulfate permease-like transporter
MKGYHDITRHPEGLQIPGLVLYRWDAPLFFANAARFRERVFRNVRRAEPDARWVVVAAEPITDIDATAARELSDLLDDLDARGVRFAFAELKGLVWDQLRCAASPTGSARDTAPRRSAPRSGLRRQTGTA